MRRFYPSDIAIGGAGGLAGFYFGLSKELTIALVTIGSCVQFGGMYAWRRWKESKNA